MFFKKLVFENKWRSTYAKAIQARRSLYYKHCLTSLPLLLSDNISALNTTQLNKFILAAVISTNTLLKSNTKIYFANDLVLLKKGAMVHI